MVKRNYIGDGFRWVGILTLALCLFGSQAQAAGSSTKSVSANSASTSIASTKAASAASVSKIGNIELIYADGGVRVRVHTGAMTEFSHQIEPPKNGKPYRIILDCLNSHHNLGAHKFSSLPTSVIQRVRTSQFAVKPQAITRIVLDLTKEAFYRVEQHPKYIDLFVTDRKAKRFNSWSSAAWLADKKAKAAKKSVKAPVIIASKDATKTPSAVKKTDSKVSLAAVEKKAQVKKPAKSASKAVTAKVSKVTVAKTDIPKAKVASKSTIIAKKPVAKSVIKKATSKPSAKSVIVKESSVKAPVMAKAVESKKAVQKGVSQKSVSQKSTSQKKVALKKPVSKKPVGNELASSKVEKAKPAVKASKSSNKTVKVEKKAPVLASKKSMSNASSKAPAKAVVSMKKASASKATLASKKSTKVSKPIVAKSTKKAVSKPTQLASAAKKPSKQASAKKVGASKKSIAKKPSSSKKTSVAKKASVAKKPSDKKSAKPSEKSKKNAVDNSSSLFAKTANAATPGQQSYKDVESERRYKAQFRRSIAQRKIKLKSTMVAEFPKRLTIKYKTHGTRDPFGTLLIESGAKDDIMMKELPNVEALTMVGILRDVKGRTRGLFEDIDGRGYILSKGDKVRGGTVLKVTKQKAYFQIFEYGWSRTVALSLEG